MLFWPHQDVERLLGSSTLSVNERNALIFVHGEKELYHFFIRLAEVAIPILEENDGSQTCRLIEEAHQLRNIDIDMYLDEVVEPILLLAMPRQ